MDRGRILIIMPVYNAGIFIRQAVNSILNQTYSNFHLVIVDDNSSDNSKEELLKYGNNPKISIYFNDKNVGPYNIRNFVLNKFMSRFDYFMVHDADDYSTKDRLARMVNEIEKPNIVAVTCSYKKIPTENFKIKTKTIYQKADPCYLIKREVFNKIGYYSDFYIGADTYYNKRIKLLYGENNVTYINDILMFAYQGKHNLLRNTTERERYNCIMKMNTELSSMTKNQNFRLEFDKDIKTDLYNKLHWNKNEQIENLQTVEPIIEETKDFDKDKVLILMAAYNSENFIKMSIDSVLNQTYKNFLLCIIDDASTDNTYQIAKEYEEMDSRVIVHKLEENRGSYYARNVGLYNHMKNCGYFVVHDADDFMYKERLQIQIENIGRNNGISCKFRRLDWKTKKAVTRPQILHNFLFKKSVFDRIGYYDSDTRFGGDTEYMERYVTVFRENRRNIINKVLLDSYVHGNNQTQQVKVGGIKRRDYIHKYKTRIKRGDTYINFQFIKPNKIDVLNIKSEDIDYDVVIIIPSKDRYDYLVNILNKLNEPSKYTYKIIILNDASNDKRYENLKEFENLTYLKNETNLGKHGYWITINKLLSESWKYLFRFLLQIDDDFELCDDFLDKVVDEFIKNKTENKKIVSLDYRLMNGGIDERWGCGINWVDGGGLYDYNFLNTINFKIDTIYKDRWKKNPTISSGVWAQVSKKINSLNLKVYKTKEPFIKQIECETQMQK